MPKPRLLKMLCCQQAQRPLLLLTLLLIPHFALAANELRWQQHEGYRVASVVPSAGTVGFSSLPCSQTGVRFTNWLAFERAEANQNLLNGAGVAAGDYDNDGWCDLYFCNLAGRNALFRNLGNFQFQEVTEQTGTACTNQISKGALFADLNGDGWLDLYVSSLSGPNACLINDQKGRFRDLTETAGLTLSKAGSHTAAVGDVEGDGDLDLFVTNYGDYSILRGGGTISVRMVDGRPVVSGRHGQRLRIVNGRLVELGFPSVLYLNEGQGRFTAASWTDGTFQSEDGKALRAAPWDLSLTVMFRDLNDDLAPDIYVCNDFQMHDRIWINDGRGRFRALPGPALRSTTHFTMSVDFADIDRDGLDDFYLSDMFSRSHRLRMTQISATNPPSAEVGEQLDRSQFRRNGLLVNRGDLTWTELANYGGVDATDWSWSVLFLDVDLDGFEDLLVANGHAFDTQDLDVFERSPTKQGFKVSAMQTGRKLAEYPPLPTPNVLFHNRGNRTFEEIGVRWGFNSTNVSHGLATADLDNDGDLEVIVSCMWQPPLICRNDSAAPRLGVRLRGLPPNGQGIGAKIRVLGGAVPSQTQEVIAGGRYLSGSDPLRVFAAGTLTNEMSVEVSWRNGRHSVIKGAKPNCVYEIDEAAASQSPSPPSTAPTPPAPTLFRDISERLNHVHEEMAFEDFQRQPLLHRAYSRLGPGVAWFDLDGDGHDDLIVGAGKGSRLAVFRRDASGNLNTWPLEASLEPVADDQTGIVGWVPAPGQRLVLAGLANYERLDNSPAEVVRINPQGRGLQTLSALPASAGPLAVADVDADGDLDLFVGGRILPGRYPQPPSSVLLKNEKGDLRLDEVNSQVLTNVGLVNGAVFSDLNGDGLPELVLACEWGPVRVFVNAAGKLREATPELGLAGHLGWWSGVTTADFDGDGRLDIVAGNWGLNSSYYQPNSREPIRIYYGDFDANGTIELLEAYTDLPSGRVVPRRDLLIMSSGWPALRTRFPSHAGYADADVAAILGPTAGRAVELQANTLASTVFLNRGSRFEAVPLPPEAQYAPVFGVTAADFDGDGNEDLFLSQNCFAMRLEEPRLDAGRGLCLRGDGTGRFIPMPGQESGIKIYGEQRGCAAGDFDEDGRVDLVVTQNGGATRLFHNERAKPGLRVRLEGPPANPSGVGAVLRAGTGSRMGAAREVRAGSGYWSQDSLVQVVPAGPNPESLWVRWPSGKSAHVPVPPNAREIVLKFEGGTATVR